MLTREAFTALFCLLFLLSLPSLLRTATACSVWFTLASFAPCPRDSRRCSNFATASLPAFFAAGTTAFNSRMSSSRSRISRCASSRQETSSSFSDAAASASWRRSRAVCSASARRIHASRRSSTVACASCLALASSISKRCISRWYWSSRCSLRCISRSSSFLSASISFRTRSSPSARSILTCSLSCSLRVSSCRWLSRRRCTTSAVLSSPAILPARASSSCAFWRNHLSLATFFFSFSCCFRTCIPSASALPSFISSSVK
mmetsp:Transcript_3609/g.8530  ORF Transcript_3609/g.8530 Transcript_3609/m.8530 type:complete len:261 (-) Transcript_3609:1844-2626(-)